MSIRTISRTLSLSLALVALGAWISACCGSGTSTSGGEGTSGEGAGSASPGSSGAAGNTGGGPAKAEGLAGWDVADLRGRVEALGWKVTNNPSMENMLGYESFTILGRKEGKMATFGYNRYPDIAQTNKSLERTKASEHMQNGVSAFHQDGRAYVTVQIVGIKGDGHQALLQKVLAATPGQQAAPQ